MSTYEEFLSAVLVGYRRAEEIGRSTVTCADIWDQVVGICLRIPGGFRGMFAWDNRGGKSRNRIGTIEQAIGGGDVPGLELSVGAHGRKIVVRVPVNRGDSQP